MDHNMRKGAIGELQKIAAKEGIMALWKGVGPAMVRAGALTASQLATYDEFKRVTSKTDVFTLLLFFKCIKFLITLLLMWLSCRSW